MAHSRRRASPYPSLDRPISVKPFWIRVVYLSAYPGHARDFAQFGYPGQPTRVYANEVPVRLASSPLTSINCVINASGPSAASLGTRSPIAWPMTMLCHCARAH